MAAFRHVALGVTTGVTGAVTESLLQQEALCSAGACKITKYQQHQSKINEAATMYLRVMKLQETDLEHDLTAIGRIR